MSIVKMKKLSLIAPGEARAGLLSDLMSAGCVEISETAGLAADPEIAGRVAKDAPSVDRYEDDLAKTRAAIAVLDKYAREKTSLFTAKPRVTAGKFFDLEAIENALRSAEKLDELSDKLNSLAAEKLSVQNRITSLRPWESLDVPLDLKDGRRYEVVLGTFPASFTFESVEASVRSQIEECAISEVSSDKDQRYVIAVCHRDFDEELSQMLKGFGFSRSFFKGDNGTAREVIAQSEKRLKAIDEESEIVKTEISTFKDFRKPIEQASDALAVLITQERARENLLTTETTFYMQGWVPEPAIDEVTKLIERSGAAYSLDDPEEGDDPPVLLKNSRIVEPFGQITSLYGMPQYDSVVDPNPFMAPFFFIFFGMMLSDAGYGILLFFGCLFYIKKVKPTGNMLRFMKMFMYCGISTLISGALFGSWFGDAVSVISETFFGTRVTIPALWFDPLSDPMSMLILSIALGIAHLFLGMGLSAYRQIKQGHTWDAICDVGFWYIFLTGLVLALIGVDWAIWLALGGGLAILFTAGRHEKNFFKKITGGLGALYGVTSYLSDALSYSRILALGLSTGVVAQVFNKMGSLGGANVFGVILFVLAFVVGHVFNIAINILGAFVHSSRLQYIEFFGKFFEGGGRPFAPFKPKTKYVEILKEEN